jgi:hypothetical protein
MLADTFNEFYAGAGALANPDDWRMVQNRSQTVVTAETDGHAKSVTASTTQYAVVPETTLTGCWNFYSNAGPRETPGSPVASCALDNPSASLWFEPRTGTSQ